MDNMPNKEHECEKTEKHLSWSRMTGNPGVNGEVLSFKRTTNLS